MKKWLICLLLGWPLLALAQYYGPPYAPGSSNITGGTINGTPIGQGTPAAGSFTTLTTTGLFTSYNSIATVAEGIPAVYAKADAVLQSANLSSATLYAVPASGAGLYRASCYAVVTTAATTSSTLPSCVIGWTDNDSGVALSASTVTPTNTANAPGAFGQGIAVINAKASTNITYSTSGYVSSGATAMQYAFHVKLEALGN